jgi:lipoate-protein ligase A
MITIINKKTDPRYNLALEEYVLKNMDTEEDIVLLWQNEPSIIIGRNQNTIEEINVEYVKEKNIHVVRRTSGGGAVYHDLGNLNYTFVTNNLKDNLNNYRKFTEPVIDALKDLGVPAEFSGRNDIVVDGKKISGNAQSYHKNRMFHHGTILLNIDLDDVAKMLKVKADKIESKGIKSTRSRVNNILPYFKKKMTMEEFIDFLLKHILKTDNIEEKTYHLTEIDYQAIDKLMKDKYMTWEWNYGESPEFSIFKERRYTGGNLQFHLDVKEGIIKDAKLYGDFLGKLDVKDITNIITGTKYREEDVKDKLKDLNFAEYFMNITIDDIIDCLFN